MAINNSAAYIYQRAVTPSLETGMPAVRGASVSYLAQPIIQSNSQKKITNPRRVPRYLHGDHEFSEINAITGLHLEGKKLMKTDVENNDVVINGGHENPFVTPDANVSEDGIIFVKLRNKPDSFLVYRTLEERQRNPERLNLDRRQLDSCPVLENESQLRLLNYQNNNIKLIENIENLQNLIFLDFYNNKLTNLDGPLSSAKGLRVLMAGKNKIHKITNLSNLNKLDVLDLHSNEIRSADGLESLNELRVLNLAGNKLEVVTNLGCLYSLTELNLRRNYISCIRDLDSLPALQRLFLSHNLIGRVSDIQCIFGIRSLLELSLDGNPISDENPHLLRLDIISNIPSLKYFDLVRVTEDERKTSKESLDKTSTGRINEADLRWPKRINEWQLPHIQRNHDSSHSESSKDTSSQLHHSIINRIREGEIPVEPLCVIEAINPNQKAMSIIGREWEWPHSRQFHDIVELSLCCIDLHMVKGDETFLTNLQLFSTLKHLRLIANSIKNVIELLTVTEIIPKSVETIEVRQNEVLSEVKAHPVSRVVKYLFSSYLPSIKMVNHEQITLGDRQLFDRLKVNDVVNKYTKPVSCSDESNNILLSIARGAVMDITETTLRNRSKRAKFIEIFDVALSIVMKKSIEDL